MFLSNLQPAADIFSLLNSQPAKTFKIYRVAKTVSTNSDLKQLAATGAKPNTVLVAEQQTGGRGRRGRSFFSPPESGVYFSILLQPSMPPANFMRFTTLAAVAVCRAIESFNVLHPKIKWVNDIFLNGKKVCGILTEAVLNPENGKNYAVLGIGLDAFAPQDGFPKEIENIAGAVFQKPFENCKNLMIAAILNALFPLLNDPFSPKILKEYKNRSCLLGQKITFIKNGIEHTATAEDITDDFSLLVRLESGKSEKLFTGEVSCRLFDTK